MQTSAECSAELWLTVVWLLTVHGLQQYSHGAVVVKAAMRMLTRSADITVSDMSNDNAASATVLPPSDDALSRCDSITCSMMRCKFSLSTAHNDRVVGLLFSFSFSFVTASKSFSCTSLLHVINTHLLTYLVGMTVRCKHVYFYRN